nr:11309_t:CDS:2 [Entrophospora candida]
MSSQTLHPKQDAVNKFLTVPKDFRKDEARVNNTLGFTPFDKKQLKQATVMASELMIVANENPNDPIENVLKVAQEKTETNDPELVRWALMIFISHHPSARSGQLRIPPLTKRAPHNSVPKQQLNVLAPGPAIFGGGGLTAAAGQQQQESLIQNINEAEFAINFWREDPNFNEHHEHWHIVYPGEGVPDPSNPKNLIQKDRQGELFIYMHRQIHDAERVALGISLVNPLDNFDEPIPEGYNPSGNLVDSDRTSFATRPSGLRIGDLGEGMTVAELKQFEANIKAAIKKGQFKDGSVITPDLLGKTLESSYSGNDQEWEKYYGSLHNTGHVMLAYINDPANAANAENDPGVLYTPRTAARDPIFWRWHRHIDDIFDLWVKTLPPNEFLSDAPPVKIRNGDVILAFKDLLNLSLNNQTQDKEAAEFGEKNFGGVNFDSDVSNNPAVTKELQTKMKTRKWTWVEDSGLTEDISYLFPREYYYYFRVENTSSSNQDVTFRVYLAPEELANSHRHWIELDKFKTTIPAQSKIVVSRDCDMSSVVRQPPQKTEDELDDTTTLPGTQEDLAEKYCDCGWPFHLLLPRGRKSGMKFKLLVFITDWSKDKVPTLSRCGSLSFCGAEKPADKYPDLRPMGYPFDRPFKDGSYEKTFSGLNNATISDISIRWVDNFPEVKVTA